MDHPKYLRFFSTGDLLTLIAAVVAVAVAWGSMTSQMKAQGEHIAELRQEVAALRGMRITAEADARLRVVESQQESTLRDRAEMRAEISRRLDVLEQQNREILQRLPKK